jgi:molybdenum-dependent DNA-binding transcriptional regulator ModE
MADKDIWNVIFAIENEFGIAEVPSPTGGANGFIAKLFELRKEARSI